LSSSIPVAIALGSNLGDRGAHLDFALSRLAPILSDIHASSRHDTAPVDVPGNQPRYLNAAVVGRTTLTAHELLGALQAIEVERGRTRPFVNAPRTLDLDLILYGDAIASDGVLTVPHPRFRERTFVLEPLAEIAPEMVDPVSGLTVRVLAEQLRGRGAGL
jgi:2-amino-4-hydroxy-6-hydroxymethyldihydropteridine diphosphokinase